MVSPAGFVTLMVTLPGNNAGHAYYRDGMLSSTSSGGHRLYIIDTMGNATVLAGTDARRHDDGALNTATFNLPNDCFLSNSGDRLSVNEAETTTGAAIYCGRIREIVFAS